MKFISRFQDFFFSEPLLKITSRQTADLFARSTDHLLNVFTFLIPVGATVYALLLKTTDPDVKSLIHLHAECCDNYLQWTESNKYEMKRKISQSTVRPLFGKRDQSYYILNDFW